MNPRRLFVASCIALVASAFSFVIRQDVLPAWGRSFDLNAKQLGVIGGMAFWGMAVAMAIGSFVCDSLGMKKMLGLAFLCHLVGTVGTLATPYLAGMGVSPYMILCISTFLVGSANGLVEIGINPLAATLYPTEKTHKLNILHAWWPGGLMIGGLLALAISWLLGLEVGGAAKTPEATMFGWQVKTALILVPMLIYGGLFLFEPFPVTERVASGVSTEEMLKQALRPMFLLWAFCMLLTASTELAPQGMQSLVLEKTAGMNGTYVLIYTSLMMFTLRHFAGHDPASDLAGGDADRVGGPLGDRAVRPELRIRLPDRHRRGDDLWAGDRLLLADDARRDGRTVPARRGVPAGPDGCVGNLAIGVVQPWMGGVNDQITFAAIPAEVRNQIVVAGVIEPGKVKALPAEQQAVVRKPRRKGRSGRSVMSRPSR